MLQESFARSKKGDEIRLIFFLRLSGTFPTSAIEELTMQVFFDWVRKNPKMLGFYPLVIGVVGLGSLVPGKNVEPALIWMLCGGIITVTVALVITAYAETLDTFATLAHREEHILFLTSVERHGAWVPGTRNGKLIEAKAEFPFVYVPPPGTEMREPQLAYLAAPSTKPREYPIDDFAGTTLKLVAKDGKTVEVTIEESHTTGTLTWDNWRLTRQAAKIPNGSFFYFCRGFDDALQLYYVLRDGGCTTELLEAKYTAFLRPERKT